MGREDGSSRRTSSNPRAARPSVASRRVGPRRALPDGARGRVLSSNQLESARSAAERSEQESGAASGFARWGERTGPLDESDSNPRSASERSEQESGAPSGFARWGERTGPLVEPARIRAQRGRA